MAWNRQSGDVGTGGGKRQTKGVSFRKGLIAALIVTCGAFVAGYFLLVKPSSDEGSPSLGESKPKVKIAATTSAVTRTNAVKAATVSPKRKPLGKMTNEEKLRFFEEKYGNDIPDNLKSTVYFLKHPPQRTFKTMKTRADIFEHSSERDIASVLLIEPGAFMLQKPVYDASFDRDFEQSLKTPTLIYKEDSEEDRELKRAVNETKLELADRMKAGEKPSDILNAAVDQAYELGKYKRSMEEMFVEFSNDPEKTDRDVEDFVAAANKMLKDKGAGEIAMPNMVRRQAHLKMLAKRADRNKEQVEKKEN